eukprot:9510771-Lingulodinium_polyedra.AAC.1
MYVECGGQRRLLTPTEAIHLHGMPLHQLDIPHSLSENALRRLAGNTMHVQCIGTAMLLALSLTDLGHRAKSQVACPSKTPSRVACPSKSARQDAAIQRRLSTPPSQRRRCEALDALFA